MELVLALIAVVVVYLLGKARIDAVEAQLRERDQRLARLTERVFALEHGIGAAAPEPPPAVPAPVPLWTPPPVPMAPPPAPAAVAATPERKLDLEAMIGGNWLSKLGVLILLIGLALFVAFALTEFGPAGRIAIGAMMSLSLLGAGIGFERKAEFRGLGRSLLGGGWAGLYFTAFAAHGVAASRVIESPVIGFAVLLAVSAAMIGHSLRYESQTVTGLAYMAGFATIAVSSATRFSAMAAIPLLGSLLAVSWKYGWQRLAAAGASFAYLAYGFDLATGDKDRYFTVIGEPFLWIYWTMLEAYDLAAMRRGAALPVSPFNVTGFLLATSAVWPGSGWSAGPMFTCMALAQFVSAMLRGRRNAEGELEDRSAFGGYRASLTISACFATAQILDRFAGLQESLAMLLLAQLMAFSGWMLRSAYIRGLGAALFAIPLVLAPAYEISGWAPWWPQSYWALGALAVINRAFLGGTVLYSAAAVLTLSAAGAAFQPEAYRAVLLTIVAGVLGLVLRWREKAEAKWAGVVVALVSIGAMLAVTRPENVWVTLGLPAAIYGAFGAAQVESAPRIATFLAMQIFLSALLRQVTGGSAWLIGIWAVQAAVSWAGRIGALRASAYLPEALAVLVWIDKAGGQNESLGPKLVAIASILGMHLVRESRIHSLVGLTLATAAIGEHVSGPRLTLAWGAEAAAVLAAGFALRQRPVRLAGLALFAMCLGKLFFHDFSQLDMLSRIASFLVLGMLLIGASWAYTKFRDQIQRYL